MLILPLLTTVLASLSSTQAGPAQVQPVSIEAASLQGRQAQQGMRKLFPTASENLICEPTHSLLELVSKYARITGQSFLVSEETRGFLSSAQTALSEEVSIPPARVQATFEGILRQSGFVLRIVSSENPRIFAIDSLMLSSRTTMRSWALFLSRDEIEVASQHPAMLIATSVTLPNTDVRQLSNSMRTMITDANTQQMLPGGASNSMVLVGFGDRVYAQVQMLERIDRLQKDAALQAEKPAALVMQRFELQHAEANDCSRMLINFLGSRQDEKMTLPKGSRVVADARTNALIVSARQDQIETYRSVIKLLDVQAK